MRSTDISLSLSGTMKEIKGIARVKLLPGKLEMASA